MPLAIGIGLNYGPAVLGDVGSEHSMSFTVIGDTVNTAKRLCDGAEGGQIVISEEFRRALRRPPAVVACAPMPLKNKSQPVTVYRVVID
jgi:adenylate cyclase